MRAVVALEISNKAIIQIDYEDKSSYLVKKDHNLSRSGLSCRTLDVYISKKDEEGCPFVDSMGTGLILTQVDQNKMYVLKWSQDIILG